MDGWWCGGGYSYKVVVLGLGSGQQAWANVCGMMDSWLELTVADTQAFVSLSLELQYTERIFTIIDQLSPSTNPSNDIFVVCQNLSQARNLLQYFFL